MYFAVFFRSWHPRKLELQNKRSTTLTTIPLLIIIHKCMLNTCSTMYLQCSDFLSVSDLRSRQKLRSPSTAALVVPVTRHSTLGDRAFPVIAARLWDALPGDITSATSLLTFRHKLKTFLFRRSYGAWLFWILCVFVLAFYFLVFIFFWCFYVFLSCCNVFLKCSLHLYHANQFVVMIMMMNCVISCILICCTNVLIHSFVCPLWVPNSKEKQISIEKPKFMSMFSWRRMKLMCQLWSSHFIYLFSVHDTQFPRAEIWNYRNYIWNGHVTVWTWNMSARQAALKHWTVTNKRRNWNAVSTGVCHQFTY